MKANVAVYKTHDQAVEAIKKLNDKEFPMKHVSLLGKAELVDGHLHVKSLDKLKEAPALLGVGAGTLVGLLSGLGAFAIPGFGFIYGAGALVGALAGFDLGLITGGILSFLTNVGIQEDTIKKMEEHLKKGKFLVVVHGPAGEVDKAREILHTHGTHTDMIE